MRSREAGTERRETVWLLLGHPSDYTWGHAVASPEYVLVHVHVLC